MFPRKRKSVTDSRDKMRPKKRDKTIKDPPKPQFEQIQADHELFLQAFEKPTQIYRYLRTRNLVSPLFLHRNLSYMKQRCSRNNAKREGFKVDSILETVETKHKKDHTSSSYKTEYMSLTFTGFYGKQGIINQESAEVEAFLLKICHKKRKDVSSPVMQVSVGKVEVPFNPDSQKRSPKKVAAISVASEKFNYNNGHSVKSYVLLMKVICKHAQHNGEDSSESDEPPTKRRKNGKVSDDEVEEFYGAELVVYDKHKRCMLTDGDYELALHQLGTKVTSKRSASWETVSDGKAVGPFEVFSVCPTIKFKLQWSAEPLNGQVAPPSPITSHNEFLNNNPLNNHVVQENVPKKEISLEKRTKDALHSPRKRRMRIFYQFLYNNNTRQQTEAHEDLKCPWCSINCMQLYSLLKHLRMCHARFIFTYVQHPKGAQINVSINECYDGSYLGNPQDLHSHIGYAFCRLGPVRRTPVTQVLVYRPNRPRFSLMEFLEPEEGDGHCSRQLTQGHNRLYYHTSTCTPIRPQEIEEDSEGENDPEWLRQKTINMIDEFTDVNEGEKELMKLWNLHIMKYDYIGDCQIPKAIQSFVEEHGKEIIDKKIERNFLLHMINLYDFSLIKPEVIQKAMDQLYNVPIAVS